jgi:TonB family protein
MASILVVGQEQRSLERFHRVLSAEGWRVRVAQGRAQALQAAALEPPDLVLAGAELPGAEELAGAFRRSAGGPGIVVVLPETGTPTAPAVLGDDRLRQPFGDQDLVAAVRRMLAAARDAVGPAAPPVRLTSQEIFGDVLAEVEGQFSGQPAAAAAPPGPRAGSQAPTVPTPRPPGVSRDADEIQRKLEETLSGVLGAERAARAGAATASPAAPPARRGDTGAASVEAMLNKTLSELGTPRTARATPPAPPPPPAPPAPEVAAPAGRSKPSAARAAAAAAAAAPAAPAGPVAAPAPAGPVAAPAPAAPSPAPAAAPPAPSAAPAAVAAAAGLAAAAAPVAAAAAAAPAGPAAAPAAPPPSAAPAPPPGEGTGVRRRFTGELDLSKIEELARTRRKPEPSSRPGVPVPPPPAAASPAVPAPTGARVAENPAATQRIQLPPPEPAEPGEKFGQYTLLERIAVGGMAEVWKARMRGVEGFQKTVAIKKILPYMTDNADFVGMFIDEAKLAAQLSHPNIIHIYDLGKIGSDFYIAMEYVEGKDLRSLLNAARQHGEALPLGLALLIGVRLANALDYAHRKRDFEGKEMGLVHRDVSPQNVLISLDGDVKLCDFGIAKAVTKAGQTQMGALKGKLQYMSPEQAMGRPVDPRSDVFSLGTVLFEMLTGVRLFDGDSEMSVLEAVRQVKVRPPRQVNSAVPREVDDVVMHALAARPEDRFQTAGELEQRLEALLYALKPSPSNSDLAAFVRRVLGKPAEAAARADRPQARQQPARPPVAPAAAAAAAAGALPYAAPPPPPLPPAAAAGIGAPEPAAEPHTVVPLAPLGEVRAEEGSRPGRLLVAAAAAALVLGGLAIYFLVGRRNPTHPALGVPPAIAEAPVPGAGQGAAGQQVRPGAPGAPGAPGTSGSAAAGTPAPAGGKAAPAPAGKVDVQGMVDQEAARRAQETKQKLEEQQKQLQKEIEKAKAGKPQAETAASAAGGAGGSAAGAAAAGQAPPPAPSSASAAASGSSDAVPGRGQAKAATTPAAEPAAAAPSAATPPDAARERAAEPAARTPAQTAAAGAAAGAGGAAGGITTVPPKLVSSPKPEYPPLARKLGVEGVVVLSVLVDEQGRVEDVQVLEPVSQNVGINEAAQHVARASQFKPATRDGVRIKMWTRLRIPFKR